MHRPAPAVTELRDILCIKTERTVRNDTTIAHERKLYQLQEALAGNKVIVEERVDGSMRIKTGNKRVEFRQIEARPQRKKQPTPLVRKSTAHKPSADHPWRRYPAARHICTTPPLAAP
ncbi:MAG TPA: hypothetical protein VLH56_13415 [Dissulfurispiraceae bacterium]|nr:hypothetical protein [Dissulfurispiraceae bacterium]